MRSLQNVEAERNSRVRLRFIRFATITGLIIISAFALIVAGRTGSDATAKSIQINPQNALFAY